MEINPEISDCSCHFYCRGHWQYILYRMRKETFMPRDIRYLVIHSSSNHTEYPLTEERIGAWHEATEENPFHFYISRDGRIHTIRPLSEAGHHTKGFNLHSIGICYEGGKDENGYSTDTRTQWQKLSLLDLVTALKTTFPDICIKGAHQLKGYNASCPPAFDVEKEYGFLSS